MLSRCDGRAFRRDRAPHIRRGEDGQVGGGGGRVRGRNADPSRPPHIHTQEPCGAVIGMEPHRCQGSCPRRTSGFSSRMTSPPLTQAEISAELAVDLSQEANLTGAAQPSRGLSLFVLAADHEGGGVGADVPRPFRTVGAYEVVDDAAGRGPLGEGSTAPEFGVVGVSRDGEGAGGTGRSDFIRAPPAPRRTSDRQARRCRSPA